MNDIQNSLLETMKLFIDNAKHNSDQNLVINANIAEVRNEDTGEYVISYLGEKISAHASNGIKYKKNDEVYVLVPEGDFSKPKVILSKTKPSDISSSSVISISNEFINKLFNKEEN